MVGYIVIIIAGIDDIEIGRKFDAMVMLADELRVLGHGHIALLATALREGATVEKYLLPLPPDDLQALRGERREVFEPQRIAMAVRYPQMNRV